MSIHPFPPNLRNDPGPHDPGSHEADAQGYRQILNDLITMGTDLARCLHGQATAHVAQQATPHPTQTHAQQPTTQPATHAPPAPPSEALIRLTLAFDGIARAVRRSILLARTLAAPIQPAPDPARHRAAARRRIIREVEDAIQRTSAAARDGQDGASTLHAELRDRLDAPDLDDDITARPAADIIGEICRDLGLAAPSGGAPPWKRRTPGDIAQLCAQAAAPSGIRQPPAPQPGSGPQAPSRDAAQPTPDVQPAPAAMPRAQPGPIHASSGPPEDPAEILAKILHHPASIQSRWRPPGPA